MRSDDKRKVCQRTACWIAALSLMNVLGAEFGFLSEEFADKALTVLAVLLAASLAGSFYFRRKQGE